MNPDLQRERNNATFHPIDLTYVLDNGKQCTERRRYIENLVTTDPDFKDAPNTSLLNKEEMYDEGIRKAMLVHRKLVQHNITDPNERELYGRTAFINDSRPDSLHVSMFMQTLEKQLTPEQAKQWMPLAKSLHIIGTYAQTELGHGSNLRALETEAVYDAATQEFIINSPTVSSAKFWPGGLGKTCNYAAVMANLKINNKEYGMHSFLVQLRDLTTHEPCKGVTLGDIGPKLGFNMIDNGFASFDHVRIPRENMLMNLASVSPDGVYSRKSNNKLGYYAMVVVRSTIIAKPVTSCLKAAVTIATRYSAVRRQSQLNPGDGAESQVLDYQTQQYKLVPALATAYAFHFVAHTVKNILTTVDTQVLQGHTDRLPELHVLTSGLKAFCTSEAVVLLEQLRMSCGGHGFSQASGFPRLYAACSPACTYEGETTVLYLQCARYLMKAYNQIQSASDQVDRYKDSLVGYLTRPTAGRSGVSEQLELKHLAEAYEHRAHRLIKDAADSVHRYHTAGKELGDASNLSGVALVKAAKAHCHNYVVQTFLQTVTSSTHTMPDEVRLVLTALYRFYAVHGILTSVGDFLMDGYLSPSQVSQLEVSMYSLLAQIRPNAVALVDAFDIPDFTLNSCLGRYDGNVYESLMEFAKQSKLNQTEVHPSFHKYVKPTREILSSKL